MEETVLSARLPKESVSNKPSLSRRLNKKLIVEFISYFFIMLFVYSSIRKLADYRMFVREVYSLSVIEAVKWGIGLFSCLELITAVALAISKTRIVGLLGAFCLLVGLNIISFIILQRIPLVPNSFFGEIFPKVDFWGHLLINIILLFVALIGVLLALSLKKDNPSI